MIIKRPIRIRKKNCLGSLVAVDRHDKPICVFSTTVNEVEAEELIRRWNNHDDLVVTLLQVKERWWPFVHGAITASETAKKLLNRITHILNKKY